MTKRIACCVPFCRRTAPDKGQTEVICGPHWRLADRSLTRRYKALWKWIAAHQHDTPHHQRLVRRWHTAARAWQRIKEQAIERAMGI